MKVFLSEDELLRAERFRFPELRIRFVSGRALLRIILADYCGCTPADLRFSYGENQKPAIADQNRLPRTVAFNLSHSADALYIAIMAQTPVGIDVESLVRSHNVDALLEDCLADEETQLVARLDKPQRELAFLRYWVHKEAFLKCVGCGFSTSPKEVLVSFGPNGRSLMHCLDPLAAFTLVGRDIPSHPGYVAAVASAEPETALQSVIF